MKKKPDSKPLSLLPFLLQHPHLLNRERLVSVLADDMTTWTISVAFFVAGVTVTCSMCKPHLSHFDTWRRWETHQQKCHQEVEAQLKSELEEAHLSRKEEKGKQCKTVATWGGQEEVGTVSGHHQSGGDKSASTESDSWSRNLVVHQPNPSCESGQRACLFIMNQWSES